MLKRSAVSAMLLLCGASSYAANHVRIAIEKDGVYSISYDELQNMGFANPAEVAVLGRGALPLSTGEVYFNLSENQVPVYHSNNRLFFYGKGPESFSFTYGKSFLNMGFFTNNGRNIYSDYGYYLLTDNPNLKKEMTEDNSEASENVLEWGVSFICHEADLYHNSTGTGNLYWGEKFNNGNPSSQSWEFDLSDAQEGAKGTFDIKFYSQKGEKGDLSFGTSASGGMVTKNDCVSSASNLTALNIGSSELPVTKGKETVTVKYTSADNTKETANLDYWILTYPTDLSGIGKTDRLIAFPDLSNNATGVIKCNDASKLVAFDVTVAQDPILLKSNNTGFIVKKYGSATPIVTFFDPTKDQNKIKEWISLSKDPVDADIKNQASQGADLIIIAPEWLIPYANEIADIHRMQDNSLVSVLTISQVYNEFSGGLPHPEAYRKLVKYFYENGAIQPKNLLLLGPIAGDSRQAEKTYGYAQSHIMPQANSIHYENGAYSVADYYISMGDNISLSRSKKEEVNLGFGILPFYNEEDASRYIKKINQYLASESHSNNINEWLFVGGTEDKHLHDQQCVDLNDIMQDYTSHSLIGSVLAVDAYGDEDAKKKLNEYLSSGKGLMAYFGHSSNAMLGHTINFFSSEEVQHLSNTYYPFIITAGCSFTTTDRGKRGIGEEWILGTNGGAIGGLVSQRETYSSQNYKLVSAFVKEYAAESEQDNAYTIGEIYKNTKNALDVVNDTHVLLCDPALKILKPEKRIKLSSNDEIVPGKKINITGEVLNAKGATDTKFQGNVTIKLAEPAYSRVSDDFMTAGTNGDVTLVVKYADEIAAVAGAKVENGKFNVSIIIPPYFSGFTNENIRIYASAHSPEERLGAIGSMAGVVKKSDSATGDLANDVLAPVFNDIRFDEDLNAILIEVSDNEGLNLASNSLQPSHYLTLDGKSLPHLKMVAENIYDNGKRAVLCCRLPILQEGSHNFGVDIYDLAGNKASEGLQFEVGNLANSIILNLKDMAVNGDGEFEIVNAPSNSKLLIVDSSGNVVNKLNVTGSTLKWDGKDSNGNKLTPGLYKAYVREESSTGGLKRHSKVINLPVV